MHWAECMYWAKGHKVNHTCSSDKLLAGSSLMQVYEGDHTGPCLRAQHVPILQRQGVISHRHALTPLRNLSTLVVRKMNRHLHIRSGFVSECTALLW